MPRPDLSLPLRRLRSRSFLVPALVTGVAGLWAVSRALSVRCDGAAPCVEFRDLRRGAPLPEAVHIYDKDGAPIRDVRGPRRRALSEAAIPRRIAQAFVAVEDRRFWEHDGVDVRGVARAAVRNVVSGGIEEGASTIPMQLVRTLWAEPLRDVNPWRRKLIEARTAPRLVEALGRERVLALYLNAIYMGDGIYGVGEAARHYFDVPVDRLDLAQIATLVGITRSPEFYHPRRHAERARARRDVVLDVMGAAGVASGEEVREAKARPPEVVDAPPRNRYARGYLTEAVVRELRRVVPKSAGMAGLRVYTTVDTAVQRAAEAALRRQIQAIEAGRYGATRGGAGGGPLQGSAVALDPRTGAVRAWVGGRDFVQSEFDRVDQSRRQVGSLVKPFIVATALEAGVGMLDLVSTDSVRVDRWSKPWNPADHVDALMLPMREALVRSSNRAAVNLGQAVGVDALRQVSGRAGIGAELPALPSTFIGAFEASLLDVVTAYAPFGNGGLRVRPYLIRRVEGPDGAVLWEHPDDVPEAVLGEATAYLILDALRDVVDRGTGTPVRASGYAGPAAGKTGTTNEGRDAWFVGLVPDLVAGVWLGHDRPAPITATGSGGVLAGTAWARWMSAVDDAEGVVRGVWMPPPGVALVRYDPESGEVAPARCHGGRAASYREAMVRTHRAPNGGCPGGFGSWLGRAWRSLFAPRQQAVRVIGPTPRRRGG